MKVKMTRVFTRSIKRLEKKHYDLNKLKMAIELIKHGETQTLIRNYDYHILKGDKSGVSELHLEHNWILIYEIVGKDELVLLLLDTGTHDILKFH